MNDRLRQGANVLFAVTQLAAPALGSMGFGRPMDAPPPPVPENPAVYAFAIWGPIFLAAAAYAVHQALPSMRERPLYRRIGWWTALAFAAGTFWMLDSQVFGSNWSLVVLIIVMLTATVQALLSLRLPVDTDSFAVDRVTGGVLGVQGGWLTAATFLNITSVMRDSLGTFGLAPNAFALLTLMPAAALALLLIVRFRAGIWYAAGMLWALVAIAVNNGSVVPNLTMLAITGAGIAAIVIAAVVTRQRTAAA